MKRVVATVVALCAFSSIAFAEVTVSGSAAVQFLKKASDYTTGNIDNSWVRGELKVAGKTESGLSGMVHFRTEPTLTGGTKAIDLQPRQIYFKMPCCVTEFTAGRWYEFYGSGNNYFGQYLYGIGKDAKTGKLIGNGSMNTDYKVLDGAKMSLALPTIKSSFQLGVLPGDTKFETTALMAMFGGSPIEGLKFNVAGNFQIVTPEDVDGIHRAAVTCGYTVMKSMNLNVFGEAAVVNFDEASNNTWFLLGASSKVPVILDRLQAEFEIKNHRNDEPNADNNLCWMIMMRKKVKDLTFDLNFGADPALLASETPSDIGVIFRTSASF